MEVNTSKETPINAQQQEAISNDLPRLEPKEIEIGEKLPTEIKTESSCQPQHYAALAESGMVLIAWIVHPSRGTSLDLFNPFILIILSSKTPFPDEQFCILRISKKIRQNEKRVFKIFGFRRDKIVFIELA